MTRSVPEWVATHDDQAIPPRVRLRVFEREGGRCHRCGRKIGPADTWTIEHLIAISARGPHRESNMAISCQWCKLEKDAEDVAFKAKSARIRARHLGIRPPSRWPSRPMTPSFSPRVRDINED